MTDGGILNRPETITLKNHSFLDVAGISAFSHSFLTEMVHQDGLQNCIKPTNRAALIAKLCSALHYADAKGLQDIFRRSLVANPTDEIISKIDVMRFQSNFQSRRNRTRIDLRFQTMQFHEFRITHFAPLLQNYGL